MEDNIFYYPSIGRCTFPHECYLSKDAAYDRAIDMLKLEHGFDLYVLYENDIKIHKIRLMYG